MIGLDGQRFTGLVLALLLLAVTGLAAESPFDIGDRAQLFVDRILIHKADRVFFTQHSGRLQSDNPLVLADATTGFFDERRDLFVMCYQATGNRALRVEDEIWVYYDGANYAHGTLALYRAAFEDGRPTGRGRITAEFLDVAGKPIEGLQTSSRFTGDSLRQELSFPGSPDLSRWAGQSVVLRFRLQEASLYSFAFRR